MRTENPSRFSTFESVMKINKVHACTAITMDTVNNAEFQWCNYQLCQYRHRHCMQSLQVILCLEYVLGTSRFSPSTAQSMSPNYIKAWILSYVPARFDRMSADDITGTYRGQRIMRRLAALGNIAGTSPGCSYVMSTCDVLAVFTLFIPRPLETNLLILLGL